MKKRYGIFLLLILFLGFFLFRPRAGKPVRVGILHSMTGTMSISERSVAESTQLAIDELNQKGGVLGRKIQATVADGASDWPTFALQAEKLIVEERVCTLFGCWTSASRKTVKPVVERLDHLLFYPVQYEGLERSPNIVYTGAAPNQQIIPAVKWSLDHLGKRFFLVGSDYVFPRTANAIVKDQVALLNGEITGEEYLLLGSKDVSGIVQKIVQAQPDVILNTINGDSNVAFFKELRKAGITPQTIPVVSFSIGEDELRSLKIQDIAGDYAAWNYFQGIQSEENSQFVQSFRKKFGPDRVTDDPMEAAYFGVYLWAQAVEDAGTDEVKAIRRAIKDQSMTAPEGIVYIDGETQHTWKSVRIGRIRDDGQFDIVWNSGRPVRPVPYPVFRSRANWDSFLANLYLSWGKKWANPGN